MATQPRFSPHRRIESEYYSAINKFLTQQLGLKNRSQEYIISAMNNLANSPQLLADIASRIAARMVTQVRTDNARSWREAARKASRGRQIYQALKLEMAGDVGVRVHEIVTANAQLIRSIPADVREMATREVAEWQMQGLRPEAIAKKLQQRIPQLTRNKAKLIAFTETGKAVTAMTRVRAESVGIEWGQWITSEDSRVRQSHRNLDKVLMRFDDPPQPEALVHERSTLGRGLAGEFPRCRCDMLPLVSLDQISWPARIYASGSIRRMTRAQFADFAGMARRVAADSAAA